MWGLGSRYVGLAHLVSLSHWAAHSWVSLSDYKHTHNMMQPPCLKIWSVFEFGCIGNTQHFVFRTKSELLWHIFLQYYFSDLLQTGHVLGIFLCCKGLLFPLSIRLVLWSNYSDLSSVVSYHCHSTRFPPSRATALSRMDACIFVVTGCIDTPFKCNH
jgi:hypothetical protein